MADVQIIKPIIDTEHIQNYSKKNRKKKVCAYCRVSTDMEDQRTSYYSQIDHYSTMIKKNKDWEFAGVYADDGITGTQIKNREEFLNEEGDSDCGDLDFVSADLQERNYYINTNK